MSNLKETTEEGNKEVTAKKAENAAEPAVKTETEEPAEKELKGIAKIKSKDQFPVYAFIMCVFAAAGHMIGTYVIQDVSLGTNVGMCIGIAAAFIYSQVNKKKKQKEN